MTIKGEFIIFSILLIIGIACAGIIINSYQDIEINNIQEYETYSNLTYSYYDYNTGEVTKLDSGIPVYEEVVEP